MRAFTDYEQTKEYSDFQRLPAGAYEVKIIRAEDSNDALCILFDIADGEFTDYYRKKLVNDRESLGSDKAKFKGVYRLWYPNGSKYDESAKRRMKTALKTIKEDNNLNIDFSREWDGASLKDCRVGMIFQDREWEFDGKTGFTAQPYSVISLSKLRTGEFKLPEAKYLNGAFNAAQANQAAATDEPLDDLPF